jgi:hypothetical protein
MSAGRLLRHRGLRRAAQEDDGDRGGSVQNHSQFRLVGWRMLPGTAVVKELYNTESSDVNRTLARVLNDRRSSPRGRYTATRRGGYGDIFSITSSGRMLST